MEPIQYYDDEEEDEEVDAGARQDEEDSEEGDRRPAKRKRVPVPRPTAGTPAKAESLEEVEQRLQPGSVKHAIFQVWSLPYLFILCSEIFFLLFNMMFTFEKFRTCSKCCLHLVHDLLHHSRRSI